MEAILIRSVALAGLVGILAGCAAGSAAPSTTFPGAVTVMTGSGQQIEIRTGSDVRSDQRVETTPTRAWAALPRAYEELELEVDISEPAARRLGVGGQRFSRQVLNRPASDFFDCGLDPGLNRPLADQVTITASIVTTVLANGADTQLRTQIQGSARRSGGSAGTATCQSTGLFEMLIQTMVERGAAGPGVLDR